MNNLVQIVNDNTVYFVFGLVAVCILLVLVNIYLLYIVSNVNKRANRFFGRKSEKRNLEAMLSGYQEKVNEVLLKHDEIMSLIDNINERLRFCVQKVSLVRYNPFDGMGGDLSFSLVLLDEHNNGVVITTIVGREASYTYAKPIVEAVSSYNLSDEEKKAIDIAIEGNKMVTHFHE